MRGDICRDEAIRRRIPAKIDKAIEHIDPHGPNAIPRDMVLGTDMLIPHEHERQPWDRIIEMGDTVILPRGLLRHKFTQLIIPESGGAVGVSRDLVALDAEVCRGDLSEGTAEGVTCGDDAIGGVLALEADQGGGDDGGLVQVGAVEAFVDSATGAPGDALLADSEVGEPVAYAVGAPEGEDYGLSGFVEGDYAGCVRITSAGCVSFWLDEGEGMALLREL